MSRRTVVLGGVGLVLIAFAIVLFSVDVVGNSVDSRGALAETARDESLRLTIPEMRRVRNTPVYTAAANDKDKLDAGVIHLEDTGYPWQKGANVYLVGHRLGYLHTGSFLIFYDLNHLRTGDVLALRDAEGRRYVYRVFRKLIVGPKDIEVTKPVAGKNIVSLQSCTLPTYSKRLIVQAELVRIQEHVPRKPARAATADPSQGARLARPQPRPAARARQAPGLRGGERGLQRSPGMSPRRVR